MGWLKISTDVYRTSLCCAHLKFPESPGTVRPWLCTHTPRRPLSCWFYPCFLHSSPLSLLWWRAINMVLPLPPTEPGCSSQGPLEASPCIPRTHYRSFLNSLFFLTGKKKSLVKIFFHHVIKLNNLTNFDLIVLILVLIGLWTKVNFGRKYRQNYKKKRWKEDHRAGKKKREREKDNGPLDPWFKPYLSDQCF